MNTLKIIVLAFFFISTVANSQDQSTETQCSIAHEGTFTYGNSKMQITISRTKNKQVDKILYKGTAFYLYSDIEWLNDCEYNITMISSTLPNFRKQPGDVLNVKINKIEGKHIYYTTSFKGEAKEYKMTKQ